jgi:dTDP-glucose pyrophosphorylase
MINKKLIKKYSIVQDNESIKNVIKKMDYNKNEIAICLNTKKLVTGIFTEGDFRRAVYKGINLNNKIYKIVNKKFTYLDYNYNKKRALDIFLNKKINYIPVLKNFKLKKIIHRTDFDIFLEKKIEKFSVIIMAGGKGLRLDPFTKILPKPLIPIQGEAIVKKIFDKFKKFGVSNFHLVVKEKANIIKSYFNGIKIPYKIFYYHESKRLGTAGGLFFFKNKFEHPVFVSNCDTLVKANYLEILEYHLKNKNLLTVVISHKTYNLPYGICKISSKKLLTEILEKPEFDYFINTGFYIFDPSVFRMLKKEKYFDMNNLITSLIKKKHKIGVFPISENSWQDIGNWESYNSANKNIFKL